MDIDRSRTMSPEGCVRLSRATQSPRKQCEPNGGATAKERVERNGASDATHGDGTSSCQGNGSFTERPLSIDCRAASKTSTTSTLMSRATMPSGACFVFRQ